MYTRNILLAVAALFCATITTGFAVGPAMAQASAIVSK
jgi:hypothetical protein